MSEIGFETVDLGEVTLNVATAGDRAAPVLICLHGFPEYWAAWKHVMLDLAHDHFVIAPDQRGYNLSSKPSGVEAYRARHMVRDLLALAERLAPGRTFALAGHDWGASVAYATAFARPPALTHLVIANGVHPWCFQRAIFEDEGQRAASQYMNRLRAADADELMVEDDCRRTLRMIEGFSRTGWMSQDERADYRRAWTQPGAMPAMLNWYRASPVDVPAPGEVPGENMIMKAAPETMRVTVPHLVVWGEADEALRPACLEGLDRFASDLTIERVAGAGHWILHERPTEVAGLMRAFLSGRTG